MSESIQKVDIRGICDDPYCPKCGQCLLDVVGCKTCLSCGTKLDWNTWYLVNDMEVPVNDDK